MKITVARDELLKAISRVQGIVEKRTNMPILSMILLTSNGSELQISATDLELGLQQTIPAQVDKEGAVTIPGRKIFEILRESSRDTIHMEEKENNWVFITDEVTRFNLAGLPADEFPTFLEPEDVSTITVDGSILSEMINKTIYAVSMEEAGFKLSGIFTERLSKNGQWFLRMVGTDGHRLSLIDREFEQLESIELSNGVMIPKKGMSEISKLASEGGPLEFGFKQNSCIIKKDHVLLVIRLLETKFPDYHAVIPKDLDHQIMVERVALLQAMKKMLILSNERYRAVKITVSPDGLDLVSTNPEIGEAEERIGVEYEGEPLEMAFNAKYFIDVLQRMDSEQVQVAFIDNSKPCVIRGEADEGFLGLIMPMRL